MSVTIVTGNLGAGKTLQAVALIQKYLCEGKPACSNVDLNLKFLVGAKAKEVRAFRLPDRPTSEDLQLVGRGNKTKDESQNGIMVLDECGIWFNTRNWNSSGRQDIINFLLMVRKMGWDLYILVQNISVIDKQARDMLPQYVAYCTAIDKMKIPLISSLWRFFTGKAIPLPKIHFAVVRYGTSYNGLKADSWFYMGRHLYSAYNTQQIFLTENSDHPNNSQGVYSYLPPAYYYKPFNYTVKNIMRITKIYLRKYGRLKLVFFGLLVGVFAQAFWNLTDPSRFQAVASSYKNTSPLDKYSEYKVDSYSSIPGAPESYVITDGEKRLTSDSLIESGVQVYSIDSCALRLSQGSHTLDLKCGG